MAARKRATKPGKPAKQPGKPAAGRKTTAKSTVALPVGALVPQPHGGALRNGGSNSGGTGRPPSELRTRLRGSMADRINIIEEIADGEPIQRTEIPVFAILHHVLCRKCGGQLTMKEKDPIEAMRIVVTGKVSASPRDRLSAIDLAAKYGLGTKDEISVVSEDVTQRLEQQAARFMTELPADALAIVRRIVDEVWQ